jgi:L-2-hydroxyglutarate oxidase LhgO
MLSPAELREIEPHAAGVSALHVPGTGITHYPAVAEKLAVLAAAAGADIQTGAEVIGFTTRSSETTLETTRGEWRGSAVINCGGLHSDRLARLSGAQLELQIVPFRGEYYHLAPGSEHLVRTLIYPVPDPRFPFLGVHFTRKIRGGVEAGPNAVLALKREGYRKADFHMRDAAATLGFPGFWKMAAKYWKSGAGELYRSVSKRAFVKALQKLLPEIKESDLIPGGSGVRAQAVDRAGKLLDDFHIVRQGNTVHVLNVPSPAATASLIIARRIVDLLRDTAA